MGSRFISSWRRWLSFCMLAITILVHFREVLLSIVPFFNPYANQDPTCGTALEPSHLDLRQPAGCSCVYVRMVGFICHNPTAHKPSHDHGHDRESRGHLGFSRKVRHTRGYFGFGWAAYAPWACYVAPWALCTPTPPECALIFICQVDLAGDLRTLLISTDRICPLVCCDC